MLEPRLRIRSTKDIHPIVLGLYYQTLHFHRAEGAYPREFPRADSQRRFFSAPWTATSVFGGIDHAAALQTLRSMADMDLQVVLPGHGGALTPAQIRARADRDS